MLTLGLFGESRTLSLPIPKRALLDFFANTTEGTSSSFRGLQTFLFLKKSFMEGQIRLGHEFILVKKQNNIDVRPE